MEKRLLQKVLRSLWSQIGSWGEIEASGERQKF